MVAPAQDSNGLNILAGIAQGEIDQLLPSVLAALLADNTNPETLRTMISSL
jgi:hypothetical protein